MQNLDSPSSPKTKFSHRTLLVHRTQQACCNCVRYTGFLSVKMYFWSLRTRRKGKRKPKSFPNTRAVATERTRGAALITLQQTPPGGRPQLTLSSSGWRGQHPSHGTTRAPGPQGLTARYLQCDTTRILPSVRLKRKEKKLLLIHFNLRKNPEMCWKGSCVH